MDSLSSPAATPSHTSSSHLSFPSEGPRVLGTASPAAPFLLRTDSTDSSYDKQPSIAADVLFTVPEGYIVTSARGRLTAEVLRNIPPAELRAMRNVRIENPGTGSITFLEAVDLSNGANLAAIVRIGNKAVDLYPEGTVKPEPGQGLNLPARITLSNVFPINKSTRERDTDAATVAKFVERVKVNTTKMGATFVSYEDGVWTFEVEHF